MGSRSLRIIAGSARGRKLQVPPGRSVRPTSDRVREALFNILAAEVTGCRFLDLYAGSGAVGIEALSRGAEQVDFVEQVPTALQALQDNLQRTGLGGAARVHPMPVRRALTLLVGECALFDLVFADPPYGEQAERSALLEQLGGAGLLRSGGRVIVEFPARRQCTPPATLKLLREARYGDTVLVFLQPR
jgi:16S rRNA (guanine(966)-N(2))-methyltransferase RsmD